MNSNEAQDALRLITSAASADAVQIADASRGTPEQRRLVMLETVPGVVVAYGEASAALAADAFDDERARLSVPGTFRAELVVEDRTVAVRRAVAWAAEPMFTGEGDMSQRLSGLVQEEVARPYRDTILTNTHRDPQSIGWRRNAGDACPFCRMAADKGAVYRRETATFAAHDNCDCTASPVYLGSEPGPEASAMQYIGAKRTRTPRERKMLREYLDTYY